MPFSKAAVSMPSVTRSAPMTDCISDLLFGLDGAAERCGQDAGYLFLLLPALTPRSPRRLLDLELAERRETTPAADERRDVPDAPCALVVLTDQAAGGAHEPGRH